MRLKSSFLVFMLLIGRVTLGQEVTSSTPRHTLQQQYILETFMRDKEKIEVKDTIQLDSLFQVVESSWKEYVKDSLSNRKTELQVAALNNLDAYSYLMTLIWKTGKTEIKEELESHLFKKYMLPSLKKDYLIVKSNPSLETLKYIWRGSLSNTIAYGSKYTSDVSTYNEFYSLFFDLKNLLKSLNKSDQDTKDYALKLLSQGKGYEYDIISKYYFLNNQPDLALSNFITGLSVNKYLKTNAIAFSRDLLEYFYSVNEKDKCFAILNTLMFYTTNDEIPRDSLAEWYEKIDTELGASLYAFVTQKISGETFKTSNQIDLKLPENLNLISNHISEPKIQSAKFILIDFWYTGCAPCIAEIPKLNELAGILKNREDIIFLSINTDYSNGKREEEVVKDFVKKHNISFPVVYDNQQTHFNEKLKIRGYPAKFILDNEGRLITKIDNSHITLETLLDFVKQNE